MVNVAAAEKLIAADFDSIPPSKFEGIPQGNLWGYFDLNGKKDKLGTLNYLTPDRVKESAKEIQSGERVQLDWGLASVTYPGFGRQTFEHKVIIQQKSTHNWTGSEDVVHFNTQSSSQWDGLQHVGHQATETFYNNLSMKDVVDGTDHNGIDEWVKAGGLAGRGVFLDWLRWYEATTGEPGPDPTSDYQVPYTDLVKVAEYQGTEFKPGDILIVRFGYVRWYNNATDAQRKAVQDTDKAKFVGVRAEPDAVRWFWNRHFSAVAGDNMSFETWPLNSDCLLHEWFLALWGTPIGELWDLEKLSETCARLNKWSFFFTSAPLNVPNGVASTPNAIAVL